jgi:hypothetical protein
MAITVYSGAIANTVWTTDKASISTGTNSVTAQVRLSGKPTANASAFLYNDGNQANSVPIVISANSKRDIWVGVGNQLTIVGGNGTAAEIGAASSGNAGVMD